MASATTAQFYSRSWYIFSLFSTNLFKPFSMDLNERMVCANGTPILRNTVESVRSRCSLEIGNLAAKCSNNALAIPNYLLYFQNLLGLLCVAWQKNPLANCILNPFCKYYDFFPNFVELAGCPCVCA